MTASVGNIIKQSINAFVRTHKWFMHTSVQQELTALASNEALSEMLPACSDTKLKYKTIRNALKAKLYALTSEYANPDRVPSDWYMQCSMHEVHQQLSDLEFVYEALACKVVHRKVVKINNIYRVQQPASRNQHANRDLTNALLRIRVYASALEDPESETHRVLSGIKCPGDLVLKLAYEKQRK